MKHPLPCLVLLAFVGTSPPATGQLDHEWFSTIAVDQLKRSYLHCDMLATQGLLDFGVIAMCSIVSEELKHRAFGGDFDQLLAWWQAEKRAGHLHPAESAETATSQADATGTSEPP